MVKEIKLSIIIVGFNIKEYVILCLRSILAQEPSFPFEIIYVDNCSTDGTVPLLKNLSFKIKILEMKKNLGFARANNFAAKESGGEYLLFLNPDTEIFDDSLTRMVTYLEKHPEIGILGPKLVNNRKMDLQISSVGRLDSLTALFAFSFLNKYFPNNSFSRKYFLSDWDRNSIKEVGVVSGAAILINKDLFKKIGGFDEQYFMYFEENDLCLAVEKLGKKVVYFPEAKIIHYLSRATAKVPQLAKNRFFESRYHFFKKHFGFLKAIIINSLLRLFEKLTDVKN